MPIDTAALLAPPDIHTFRHILCVQPHPDDVEVGMGGIVAALADAGCRVTYLTVTNGDQGNVDPDAIPEETAATRRYEAEASGRFLGVSHFIFLEHGDGTLADVHSLSFEIAHVLREVKPDAVFTPDPWLPYEGHLDHIITGKAVSSAFQLCGRRSIGDSPRTEPYPVPAIGYYFTANPNTIVDITDLFERKMTAIAMHESQTDEATLLLFRAYFEMNGRQLGALKGYGLGEGVKLLSRLHTHCFVDAVSI